MQPSHREPNGVAGCAGKQVGQIILVGVGPAIGITVGTIKHTGAASVVKAVD